MCLPAPGLVPSDRKQVDEREFRSEDRRFSSTPESGNHRGPDRNRPAPSTPSRRPRTNSRHSGRGGVRSAPARCIRVRVHLDVHRDQIIGHVSLVCAAGDPRIELCMSDRLPFIDLHSGSGPRQTRSSGRRRPPGSIQPGSRPGCLQTIGSGSRAVSPQPRPERKATLRAAAGSRPSDHLYLL